MNLNNWVYLLTGICLGVGITFILLRVRRSDSLKEQQIKQMQLAYHMAEEMSQFKAGFLARTTHELRSPLNGLINLHQLILSDLCENPEEEKEFIAQAHERALKLLKLMDEILSVARTEHGTHQLDMQSRSLFQVLQEVYDITYMLAANRNFPFQLLLPAEEIYVVTDHRWLRQVLLSLVENCISRMEQGALRISTENALDNSYIYIWLDVPNHSVFQSESIDLMEALNLSNHVDDQEYTISPGMKLLLNQVIVETMGGKLEILSSPTNLQPDEDYTRFQIAIRREIVGTEPLHLQEN